MIMRCSCVSAYQDKTQGRGNRIHNPVNKKGKGNVWRCTVCKKETTR